MGREFEKGKPVSITLGPDMMFLFPKVFEKDEKDNVYKACVLIPYGNKKMIALFEDAVDAAIARGYSGELSEKSTFKKGTKESTLKMPLKDGADANEDYADLFENHMYFNCKTDRKPKVLDANGQEIIDPSEFRMGAIGAVSVTVYPYNFENQSQGVGVQLNHIMQLKESTFEGGAYVDPNEAFADYMPSGRGRDENERPARGRTESRSRGRGGDNPFRERDGSDDPMFD